MLARVIAYNAARRWERKIVQFNFTRCLGEYERQDPKSEEDVVNISFVLRDGTVKKVRGKVGDNLLFLAHR